MSNYEECPNCGLKFRQGRAIHSHRKSCDRFTPVGTFVERWNTHGRYSIMTTYYSVPASTISNYMTQLRRSPMWGDKLLPAKKANAQKLKYVNCDICGNEFSTTYMKRHLQTCVPKSSIPDDAPRCDCTILLKTKDELKAGQCVFCQQTQAGQDYLQVKHLVLRSQLWT